MRGEVRLLGVPPGLVSKQIKGAARRDQQQIKRPTILKSDDGRLQIKRAALIRPIKRSSDHNDQ